jgi:exosortase
VSPSQLLVSTTIDSTPSPTLTAPLDAAPAQPVRTASAQRDLSRLAPGLAFLLVLAFYWPTVWSFTGTWNQGWMNHGWLIGGLTVWLIWRSRSELLRGRAGDPVLLVPLVGLSLVWIASMVAHIQLFHQTAFALAMVCWGLMVFGRAGARTVLKIGATFTLALPLWDVLVPVLKGLAVVASGALVKLAQIPAEIHGDVIHTPVGWFEVANGCSGINYLLAGLTIGAFYAHTMVRRVRSQLLVIALIATIMVVMNWIRVAALVVIGYTTEMQSPLITDSHVGFGWILFTLALIPFFLLAGRIDATESPKARPATIPAADDGARRLRTLTVCSTLAVLGPALYLGIGALPDAQAAEPDLASVKAGSEWYGLDPGGDRALAWHPAFQGATEHEARAFTDGSALVQGDRFVFREQAQGAKLIGTPNRIASGSDILATRTIGPVDPDRRRWVRQAIVRTPDDGVVLTWYWYRVGGAETFMPAQAKLLEVPAFLRRHRVSELVAFTAPCGPEDCQEAFEALADFMGLPTAGATASTQAASP